MIGTKGQYGAFEATGSRTALANDFRHFREGTPTGVSERDSTEGGSNAQPFSEPVFSTDVSHERS